MAHYCISAKSPPSVSQAEGTYHFDSKNSVLEWEIPLINNSNKKGNLEFEIVPWESSKNDTTSLFPITVSFNCDKTLCNMDVSLRAPGHTILYRNRDPYVLI